MFRTQGESRHRLLVSFWNKNELNWNVYQIDSYWLLHHINFLQNTPTELVKVWCGHTKLIYYKRKFLCQWLAEEFGSFLPDFQDCYVSTCNLNSDSHLPKNLCFICFNENPLKTMKNASYFILKALFVLKIFKLSTFWSCRKNGLIRKTSLTAKLMASQPG